MPSTDVRPLIAIPSPRDIPFARDNLNTIEKVPKLWVKYFSEAEAYQIIQSYFLEKSKDTNYLIISPDDLVVTQKDYQELVKTIHDFGGPEKMPTLAAVCNIHNIPGYVTQLAICIDTPIHPQRRRRHYQWADMRNPSWTKNGYDKMRLLEVKFSGFGFQFIRRDIIEKIGLQGDLQYNGFYRDAQNYSFDVIFCWMCLENKIPIYVNPQVKLLHLRGSHVRDYEGIEPLLVGKKDPKVIYVDEEGKGTDITEECLSFLPKSDRVPSARRLQVMGGATPKQK